MVLTFKENEERVFQKILSILSDEPEIRPVQPQAAPVISFPGLTIYPYQRQVFRGETEIPLTHLEFSVLLYLAQQPGRVFSQQQIFEVFIRNNENIFSMADRKGIMRKRQIGIEQNRCAMACQGCGIAIFCFL